MGAETNIDIRRFQEGGDTPSSVDIYSSDQSVDVTEVNEGEYDLKVSQDIIDLINSKQDAPNAGGLRTDGIESLWFGINISGYPDTAITGVHAGDYIPLFEINAFNAGKAQLGFEIISREDTAGYYSKFFFVARGNNFLFLRTDYYNKPVISSGVGYFAPDAIVIVQDGQRYLICKKTLQTGFDAFIVNQLYRDSESYSITKRYTTFTTERYLDPNIVRASAMTTWRNKIIASSGMQPQELDSNSINVNYDNTLSQATATNVQAALDDLYAKYNALINN